MNENKKNHQILWNYLGEHPEKTKIEALESLNLPMVFNLCFACVEAIERRRHNDDWRISNCEFCPIKDWTGKNSEEKIDCCDKKSLFNQWGVADGDESSKLAFAIANLEWEDE